MKVTGEGYELYCGDCLDILPTLPVGSVDAIICDLPYGTTACEWDSVIPLDKLWPEFKRVIKPRGAVVLFGSQPFTSALVMSNLDWFRYEWIWSKSKATGHLDANRRPLKSHESIVVFYGAQPSYCPQMTKGKIHHRGQKAQSKKTQVYGDFSFSLYYSDEHYPQSVIKMNVVENAIHPTQKPVDLLAYLILTYTNPGETVLDCTFGSGTTGVAALQTGRRFIGMESDGGYFEIAHKRIEDAARAAAGLPKQLNGRTSDYADVPLFSEVTP